MELLLLKIPFYDYMLDGLKFYPPSLSIECVGLNGDIFSNEPITIFINEHLSLRRLLMKAKPSTVLKWMATMVILHLK